MLYAAEMSDETQNPPPHRKTCYVLQICLTFYIIHTGRVWLKPSLTRKSYEGDPIVA